MKEFLPDDWSPEDEPLDESFAPVKPGEYIATIERAEVRDTKAGGAYLSLGTKILGPTSKGAWVWGSITLKCPSSTEAERIGRQHLAQLLHAVGKKRVPRDPQELVGYEVKIVVFCEEYNGLEKPKVRRYLPTGKATPAPTAAAPSKGSNPWE